MVGSCEVLRARPKVRVHRRHIVKNCLAFMNAASRDPKATAGGGRLGLSDGYVLRLQLAVLRTAKGFLSNVHQLRFHAVIRFVPA